MANKSEILANYFVSKKSLIKLERIMISECNCITMYKGKRVKEYGNQRVNELKGQGGKQSNRIVNE